MELGDGLRVGEVAAEGVSVAFQELVLASLEEDVVGCEIYDYAPCVEKDHPGSGDPVRVSEPQLQPQVLPVAAYTGLRWGELCALRVQDVKLNRLEVNEALKEINGELIFGPTKTHANRAVSLPAFLRELLAEQIATDTTPHPAALVFTGPDGGPLRHSGFYRRHFKPAVTATLPAEVHRLRFHDLRHTCASLLIAGGAHAKSIQVRLGHSTITMTIDRYGHLLPSLDDALAATLDAAHKAATTPVSNIAELPVTRHHEKPAAPSTAALLSRSEARHP